MNTLKSLQDKINSNEELDFGTVLTDTITLFKKAWLQGFLLVVLLFALVTPILLTIYIPIFSETFSQLDQGASNPLPIRSLQQLDDNYRYMIIAISFIITFFTTAFVAAFYRIIKNIDYDESFKFLDFFFFFKAKYLGKIFALASFSLLIALLNFAFEKFLPPSAAGLINAILGITSSVYTMLFVVFFAFNSHLESADFFTLSFSLGTKKWFFIFGILFVSLLMAMVGVIACFVGVLFTISIVYLPCYLIYKTIFGFGELSDIDRIGSDI